MPETPELCEEQNFALFIDLGKICLTKLDVEDEYVNSQLKN